MLKSRRKRDLAHQARQTILNSQKKFIRGLTSGYMESYPQNLYFFLDFTGPTSVYDPAVFLLIQSSLLLWLLR